MIIKNDTFFIASRLKEIDRGYFIRYHKALQRYEVHHTGQGGDTLCLIVPYDSLDVRTYDLVLKTRVENFKRLMEEMEHSNEKLGGSYFALS